MINEANEQYKLKHKIINQTLAFFKNMYNLKIIHPTETYNYSSKNLPLDQGNVVGLAKRRRPEDRGKPYSLPSFNMLFVRQLFPSIYGNPLNMFLHYLKSFCKADMSSIGIVGLSRNEKFNIFGVQPYIPLFHKYGILTDNILMRTDYQKAYKDGAGDGWWRSKNDVNNQWESISIYVKLQPNSNIKNYLNRNKWLEICESSNAYDNTEFGSVSAWFGAGMERILYHFFNVSIKWS